MTLKVAIVGCGKIADGHVEEIQKLPELARVVAVCDLEPLMAEQLALRYGVAKHYGDLDALLSAERPDVVHIATPPGPHLSLVQRVVESGCHVFVEKPVAPTHAETKQLIEFVEQAGKKLTVGYTYLFDPPALAMRELMAQGLLGDPVHVESYYGYSLSGPFGAALLGDGSHWVHRLPGKLIQNNIDHLLNKLVEFVDDDRPRVLAVGRALRRERFGDVRDEMHDELRLLVDGERVSAYGTFSSHARPVGHFCRVYGTKNTMHVDYVMRTVTFDATTRLPSAIGRLVPAFDQAWAFAQQGGRNVARFVRSDFHFFAGLNELLRRFYRSIVDDTPPPIPYRDVLRISQMTEDIFAQLKRPASASHRGGAAA